MNVLFVHCLLGVMISADDERSIVISFACSVDSFWRLSWKRSSVSLAALNLSSSSVSLLYRQFLSGNGFVACRFYRACSGYITTLGLFTSLPIRSGLLRVVLFEAFLFIASLCCDIFASVRMRSCILSTLFIISVCIAPLVFLLCKICFMEAIGHLLRNV